MCDHNDLIEKVADNYGGQCVKTNPAGNNRHILNGLYPDVIVLDVEPGDVRCEGAVDARYVRHIFEVETSDSIEEEDDQAQWTIYDEAFRQWYLVVPIAAVARATELLARLGIRNVTVHGWDPSLHGGIGGFNPPLP